MLIVHIFVDILDVILKEDSSLEDELDGEGRSCLSVGAFIGFNRGVCYLLSRSTKNVYVCNNDGSFPIHIAMKRRQIYLVSAILERCPDSKYLLNRKGQNILHIAANSGKNGFILFIYLLGAAARSIFLRDGGFSRLMEKQDVDGNTPLHLATMNWRPRTIFCLLCYYNRKCMATRNNSGLTALDIAESNMHPNYIFREVSPMSQYHPTFNINFKIFLVLFWITEGDTVGVIILLRNIKRSFHTEDVH